jgi:hypothetical protein
MIQNQNPALQFISPFTWVIGRLWFQSSCLVMGAYLVWYSCATIFAFNEYGKSVFSSFRIDTGISVEGLSENYNGIRNLSLARFQLLLDGCSVWASENITAFDPSNPSKSPSFTLPRALLVDGSAVTLRHHPNSIYNSFYLYGSNDHGLTWTPVSTSNTRLAAEGVRFLSSSTATVLPTGKEISFENRLTWPVVVESVMGNVILAFGCFGVALSGFYNRPVFAKRSLVWCTFGMAAINLISSVGYVQLGLTREIFFPCMQFLAFLAMAFVLHLFENFVAEAMAAAALLILFGRAVQDVVIFGDASYLVDSPPVPEVVIALAGFVFILSRRRYWEEVLQTAEADQAGYDAEWAKIQTQPRVVDCLSRLSEAAERVARGGGNRRPLHCIRLMSVRESNPLALSGHSADRRSSGDIGDSSTAVSLLSDPRRAEPGTWDARQPVESLDQLYTQAVGIAPDLFRRCKEWAEATGGAVDEGQGGAATDSLPGWMGRRWIKRAERAIEKAAICYGGDVSRLVDLCRGRIVFEDLHRMCACLEVIGGHRASVAVLRIKNGLDVQHDATRTAGFRVSAVA